MRSTSKFALGVAAIVAVLFIFRKPIELRLLAHETVSLPDASGDPIQVEEKKEPFEVVARAKSYRLFPRFRWDQSAHVMGVESYRFDSAAALMPVDLALAWGPLLESPYRKKVWYSQSWRYYFWGYKEPSLDRAVVVTHSANMHVIPSTWRLRRALACMRKGDYVRLQGWLVDAGGIDRPGLQWTTSATRHDEGPGGCEIVYLTRLTVNSRAYE